MSINQPPIHNVGAVTSSSAMPSITGYAKFFTAGSRFTVYTFLDRLRRTTMRCIRVDLPLPAMPGHCRCCGPAVAPVFFVLLC